MLGQTNDFTKPAAKTLRRSMTDAERKLWHRLRDQQLGAKFRRQHPFENYILDFVCLDCRLVVEVDGSQHVERSPSDDVRTAMLSAAGFKALRFWNNEVLNETDAVVQAIWQALNPSPLAVRIHACKRGSFRRRLACESKPLLHPQPSP